MRVSILVASKSQYFSTSDDVIVRGCGLSVTQFLRGIRSSPVASVSIDEFIFGLKEFIDTVRLEQAVLNDCQTLISSFALNMTIFTKFEELCKKVALRDRTIVRVLAEPMKRAAWLVFILGKILIHNRRGDLVDFAYLMAASIHIVVIHAPIHDVSCALEEEYG